ncbi:hypothetical protein D6C85_02465 [Aureobasidium pullulans]|uniref:Uncharacterized protein n=1 Tax=Aureobasidium pullulans TaxID=5580 RepID=A0A4S9RMT3_AURPU|nr:hypothetical protein D6C92_02587 [Aureobasidium pullulans]THZ76104.1 hypothetical protein D6C85_02465 [Aureobasidium pullulans]
MKLFTALTLIYATLAAAAPSHLLLRDNKPPPPMMPVYISGLPSDNDESNMKCGFFEVKQRDLRHAMEWGTNLRISKHYNGKNKYPHRWQNARDDTIVPLPLFRMSGICSPPGGGYFFEYPIIEGGFYAGEDDTLLFRAVFMITDTDPYKLQVNYCGTIWRNKKANGGYLSCDLEDFFAHMPLGREEANIKSSVESESPRRQDFV